MGERAKGFLAMLFEDASSIATLAVFSFAVAWVLGVLHLRVDLPERFAMSVLILGTLCFVVSQGVEAALKRMMETATHIHIADVELPEPEVIEKV